MNIWKNLVAATLFGACAQACAEPILAFDTNGGQAVLGSMQDYAVTIADVADLYGYQFSINYDARYLRALGIAEGGFLGGAGNTFGDTGIIDNASGTISFVYNSLIGAVPGASGNGTLANIRFEAIGVGNAALSFADLIFLDSGLNDIALDVVGAQVGVIGSVAEVPEPAGYLLIGVGLVAVGAMRRRGFGARA